jgi:hypothetical protein
MAKDSRIGESLWFIWDGDGYTPSLDGSIIFYTEEHVDIENETVRKALASSLQREGITTSLSQAFSLIDAGINWYGYIGSSPEEHALMACEENGETIYDIVLDDVVPVTWVEVFAL